MERWLVQAIDYGLAQIYRNLAELDSFPELTENSRWRTVEHGGWVGGHWAGLIWLAFAHDPRHPFQTSQFDRSWPDLWRLLLF